MSPVGMHHPGLPPLNVLVTSLHVLLQSLPSVQAKLGNSRSVQSLRLIPFAFGWRVKQSEGREGGGASKLRPGLKKVCREVIRKKGAARTG